MSPICVPPSGNGEVAGRVFLQKSASSSLVQSEERKLEPFLQNLSSAGDLHSEEQQFAANLHFPLQRLGRAGRAVFAKPEQWRRFSLKGAILCRPFAFPQPETGGAGRVIFRKTRAVLAIRIQRSNIASPTCIPPSRNWGVPVGQFSRNPRISGGLQAEEQQCVANLHSLI